MSYNLLLNTEFKNSRRHWTFLNCHYSDGYLVSDASTFAIEQEIILPESTRLYFGFDYITFDKAVKNCYCGLACNTTLEVNKQRVHSNQRKRISVVHNVTTEKLKVVITFEAKVPQTRVYIDNLLLVDLTNCGKDWWPRWMLDRCLYYKQGYDYTNDYHGGSEIKITNTDFHSRVTKTEKAKHGIILSVTQPDSFTLTHEFHDDQYYLVKLDLKELNCYGSIIMKFGETVSTTDAEQLYMVFRGNSYEHLRIEVDNQLPLPYLINLKHIMIINISKLTIEQNDIKHLPYVD